MSTPGSLMSLEVESGWRASETKVFCLPWVGNQDHILQGSGFSILRESKTLQLKNSKRPPSPSRTLYDQWLDFILETCPNSKLSKRCGQSNPRICMTSSFSTDHHVWSRIRQNQWRIIWFLTIFLALRIGGFIGLDSPWIGGLPRRLRKTERLTALFWRFQFKVKIKYILT